MKNKTKSKKDGAKKEVKEEMPQKIDYSTRYKEQVPICVKIKHKNETFFIFTEEYKKSFEIKEQISKIKKIPIENLRLYYTNKRLIEDDAMNHDQQIKHNTILYAAFKQENNEWENFNELINFKNSQIN
jgi:hypothetical protein